MKGKPVKYMTLCCSLKNEEGQGCNEPTKLQVGSGTGNAYKHMVRKHFNNDDDAVAKAYLDAMEEAEKEGRPINTFLKTDTFNPKEHVTADWIELIVMENLPLDAVKSLNFC